MVRCKFSRLKESVEGSRRVSIDRSQVCLDPGVLSRDSFVCVSVSLSNLAAVVDVKRGETAVGGFVDRSRRTPVNFLSHNFKLPCFSGTK